MSGLLGDEERADTWTIGDDGRHSRTEAVTVRALAPAGWLRQLPPGEAVLVYGSFPPARIALRPFFDDRELASRAVVAQPGDAMPCTVAGASFSDADGPRHGSTGHSRLGTRRARLTAWSPRRS